jgi:hypothetical protein
MPVRRKIMSNKYYTNKEAFEHYITRAKAEFPLFEFTLEDCPSCGRFSVKTAPNGHPYITTHSWVDAVTDLESGEVECVAWCLENTRGGKIYRVGEDRLASMVHAVWGLEDETADVSQPGLCTCDYDTVVRIIGCQCGGR